MVTIDCGTTSDDKEEVSTLGEICLRWSYFAQEMEGTSVSGGIRVTGRWPDEASQKKPAM